MATSLPWFPAWDMEMAHKGIVKRNLGYTCTLINRCRALLQRLLHLVISETAPVYVAQLIKCFGVWKVKVCINQCIFIVWYRQNYILAFSLESGIICVSSFLNSLINVVLTYSTVFMRCFGKAAHYFIPLCQEHHCCLSILTFSKQMCTSHELSSEVWQTIVNIHSMCAWESFW